MSLIFDPVLGKVVRFGGGGPSLLTGETWTNLAPTGWPPSGWSASHVQALHDARSGETLVLDFESGQITRFDIKRCALVGEFSALTGPSPDGRGLWTYHAERQEIVCQVGRGPFGRYRMAIGSAIAAAAKLGPRSST
jgi:hypothetical protein